ncbi:MAG: LPS export ABC transporter permease LptG [Dechloromonas sp.]|jgi:lipopolysaccharide export system permease protein|nr:LPS export ABC transporter permease LptG [Dechloromonas sp.]
MIHRRYLMREALKAVFLVLLAFVVLFAFFDFIEEARSVGQGRYGIGVALGYVFFSIPGLAYEFIPVACLIGTLYALATFARHSEIVVLRASGMSMAELLGVFYRVAAILAILTFVLGELVVPFSGRMGQELKSQAMNKPFAQQGFLSGVWIKDGMEFINFRQAASDSFLERVRIYRFDSSGALQSVLDARTATFADDGKWVLDGLVKTTINDDVARVEHQETDVWQSSITPRLLSSLMVLPERMSLYDLFRYTRHLSANRQNTERYEIAIWKKLFYPLASLVMVTLALPFGYVHDRVGGVSLKIFAGVMLGIAFYALNGLFSNLGVINAWPPMASAAAPAALFFLAAVSLIWWVERR